MSLYYLTTINKYLGHFGIYDPKEVIETDQLEKQWQSSLSNYSLYQWLDIFPQAKPRVRQILKEQIKQYKSDIIEAEKVKTNYNNTVLSKTKYEDKWFYTLIRDLFYVYPLSEGKEKLIKKNYFYLSALKDQPKTINSSKLTDQDVAKAKTCPIENFYYGHLHKRGSTYVALCPLHKEKTPSFTIYSKENRWYCYGESVGGDVIDFVKKLKNCSFLEAVKFILNK